MVENLVSQCLRGFPSSIIIFQLNQLCFFMKQLLLSFALFLFLVSPAFAQQPPGECPGGQFVSANTCQDACVLCDIDGLVGNNNTDFSFTPAPPGFCAQQLHNTQWVGFVAGTPNIQMEITPFNCQSNNGLQIGIYQTLTCESFQLVSECYNDISPFTPATFNMSGLQVGGIYFIVVDGTNGDICDFSVDVTQGSTVAPEVTQSATFPSPINSPFCVGETLIANATTVPFASIYTWTLNGVEVAYSQNTGIEIPQGTPAGTAELCVTPSNPCSEGGVFCRTIVILPPDMLTASATICEGESYSFHGQTFSSAGTYTVSDYGPDGCLDIYQFTLNVQPPQFTNVSASICQGDIYWVGTPGSPGSQQLFASGTYNITLPTLNRGCDSTVNLTLTVGPDSISTTNLEASFCNGDTYEFNGDTLTAGGVYTAVLQSQSGCDSIITLTLTALPTAQTFLQATICGDSLYVFYNDTLTQSGLYTEVLDGAAANGCDSSVTLSLTVLPVSSTGIDASICTGESYEFHGDTLTAGGIYTAVLTNANGCDSTIILTLVELAPSQTALVATICSDDTYLFDGDDLSESGVYTPIYTNEVGCDSIVTLNLTVVPADLGSSLAVTICEESAYDFYGDALTQSGIYTALLTNVNGCDSTITLTLTVREPDLTLIEASVCAGETYLFNGENLGAPGAYTALLVNANGCDSLVILNLTVLPVSASTLTASFCSGDTYAFNGEELSAGGVYTALLTNAVGCDSTVTLTLTELATSQTLVEATICEGEAYPFEGGDYIESGVYEVTYANAAGCDSTITLNLTVLPNLGETLNVTICEEETYEFYGETLAESGVYTQVFPGSNGCDSTITLNLTVRLVDLTLLEETFCEGQTFLFNGENLSAPGAYTALLTNSDGCDSLVILNLSLSTSVSTEVTDFFCESGSYDFNGQTLTEAGIYTAMLTTEAGCDSTVTLTLTVRDPDLTLLEESICEGQSYEFNGETLFAPGAYTALLTNSFGCDSLVILNLTAAPTDITPTSATICEGDVYDFYGQNLTEQGIYVNALTNVNGCDSNIVLTLTVLEPDTTLFEIDACEGQPVVFNGQMLVESGVYTALLTNSNGCDSLVVLDLVIVPTTGSATEASICANEGYPFNGEVLTEAGTYVFVLTNAAGCDSTAVLNLAVLPVSNTTVEARICEGETYLFNGTALSESGGYEATFTNIAGCDSTVALLLQVDEVAFLVEQQGQSLTVEANDAAFQWINCATNLPIEGATGNVFMPTVTGSYAVVVTQEGCTATSDCFAVTVVSTENPSADAGWQVLPNPTSGLAQLRMDTALPETIQLQLFDLAGRLCLQQTIAAGETDVQVDLNRLADGVFLARLSGGAFATKVQRIVKVSR